MDFYPECSRNTTRTIAFAASLVSLEKALLHNWWRQFKDRIVPKEAISEKKERGFYSECSSYNTTQTIGFEASLVSLKKSSLAQLVETRFAEVI